jgi:small GTP-binding protein
MGPPSHYRRASGAIVVYDITRESTFNNVKRWLENIKEQADRDVVIMLVGNKNDLVDRVVRKEEGKSLADHEAILFEETSAKEANNVNNIFEKLLEGTGLLTQKSIL